jgi:hypothetical protein
MVRLATLWAALLSAAVCLLSATSSFASDGQAEAKLAHRHGRSGSVLERVDRLLDGTCRCDAAASVSCSCTQPERRVFEKLNGARLSPELPKNARRDASAGILL